jgi:hypothetical protein
MKKPLHIDRALGDLDLPVSLNAYALLSRFKQSGGLLDLNRAIAGRKEASGSCPPGHFDRSVYLLLLADPISDDGRSGRAVGLANTLLAGLIPTAPVISTILPLRSKNASTIRSVGGFGTCDEELITRTSSPPNISKQFGTYSPTRFIELGALSDLEKAIELKKNPCKVAP